MGEDTFWEWFHREFNSSFDWPPPRGSTALVYSTMDPAPGCRNICLAWELYPEMKKQLGGTEWDAKIAQINKCAAACDEVVVSSPIMREFHPEAKLIPIGIDMNLFKPTEKDKLLIAGRAFWCGTNHPMKGYDRVQKFMENHPGMMVDVVWKSSPIPQDELARRMSRCLHVLCSGRLRPYFLVELEAMACDLRPVFLDGTPHVKDITIHLGDTPRETLFKIGFDRPSVKKRWEELLWR